MPESIVGHHHIFLAPGHERSERRTWVVIAMCGVMMLAEIIGGTLFGSVALVADGLHMSTHAGALLIAALAYTYARRHASDARFTFGTGKLGDLAGFTSAIILAMIALLIGYEAISRLFAPVTINFNQAIPIAVVGLVVNLASAWLLSGGDHHGHGHGTADAPHGNDERHIDTLYGPLSLEVFEDGVPPRFRVRFAGDSTELARGRPVVTIDTLRPDGRRQSFALADRGGYLESLDVIPEPHDFLVKVALEQDGRAERHELTFVEHDHAHGHADARTHRDNNFRAALIHVVADAAVSVLVIAGLVLARIYGWLWIDPLVGMVGAVVIANWSYGLIRDTGAILLDMSVDSAMAKDILTTIETAGDKVSDLHLWRLGPGHLGAIVSVRTASARTDAFYREKLSGFRSLSHLTIEIQPQQP